AEKESADVVLCRVYDRLRRNVIPTPFSVTDCHVSYLVASGVYQSLLLGDVRAVREHFGITDERGDSACFYGCAAYGRKESIAKFPPFVDVVTFESSPPMGTVEYFRRLGSHKLSLCLPGDVEKTYRFTESII